MLVKESIPDSPSAIGKSCLASGASSSTMHGHPCDWGSHRIAPLAQTDDHPGHKRIILTFLPFRIVSRMNQVTSLHGIQASSLTKDRFLSCTPDCSYERIYHSGKGKYMSKKKQAVASRASPNTASNALLHAPMHFKFQGRSPISTSEEKVNLTSQAIGPEFVLIRQLCVTAVVQKNKMQRCRL